MPTFEQLLPSDTGEHRVLTFRVRKRWQQRGRSWSTVLATCPDYRHGAITAHAVPNRAIR